MSADIVTVTRGSSPFILSMPHPGTGVPPEVAAQLNERGKLVEDTDWHMRQLYGFAAPFAPSIVEAQLSRFVIDLNRDPAGVSLYPGQATTELCPTTTFDGDPLYRFDQPDEAEIMQRLNLYHRPYHETLTAELDRLKSAHGRVVLYDAHSIRSHVPRLFDGELPQFNIGTHGGASCAPGLAAAVEAACDASPFSHVTNGRFRGGWITRHYGAPLDGVHAIQMELAIRGYADEGGVWPPLWDAGRAAPLQARLRSILDTCLAFAKEQA